MNVFVLGGYGKTGLPAIKLLAKSDLVNKIAIAGRNLERAEKVAIELGQKAIAVQVDGSDEQQLSSLLKGYDFLVNAATNEVVLPAIRTAIQNRAHYCDMAWAGILEQALQLNPEAEAAGITAIVATGISPCITNLMGVYLTHQLDEVEQLLIGRSELIDFAKGQDPTPDLWLEDPPNILSELQSFRPFIGWLLKRLQDDGTRTAIEPKEGKWVEVDPLKSGLEVPLAQGGKQITRPYFSSDDIWGMLPTDISKIKPVEMWFSPFSNQLDGILREQALAVLGGDISAETATSTFYNIIQDDPERWLTFEENLVRVSKVWVRALGNKDGRAARCDCWFTAPMWYVNGYYLTSVALVAAVLMVMRGEVSKRGVMTAEKTFEPLSFLDEVATLIPDLLPQREMIDESFEWLE